MPAAEGMKSRRSRRAPRFVHGPCGAWGWGLSAVIFIDVVELATFVGGLTLPFDWYSRLEPP